MKRFLYKHVHSRLVEEFSAFVHENLKTGPKTNLEIFSAFLNPLIKLFFSTENQAISDLKTDRSNGQSR
jgi:hypothetical protein